MSDFDARIGAERQRLAALGEGGVGGGEAPDGVRSVDWTRTIRRVKEALAAAVVAFESEQVAPVAVVTRPQKRLFGRVPRLDVVGRHWPVLGLFALDGRGRPFRETDTLRVEDVWLRTGNAGRARALREALRRTGLAAEARMVWQGPPIVLDPVEATSRGRAGGCFGVAGDGALLVYPSDDRRDPVPLAEALASAVAGSTSER
ncbi:hypothetical protein [Embleya sp. NBC_00896]|uniref:hypothetical protein n=1 Tax=Embleya sp. NBC_00896 TaxID=2975961 RepID=UPI003864BD5A|nr:hypothetical protein OG928_02765 [Embleya sp. NBC_00896]